MSREERILLRKREKRRRQIQEMKAGFKRFIAMLFSHIGLSGLVVAYTLLGGIIFGGIEQQRERDIKKNVSIFREFSSYDFMHTVFEEFRSHVKKQEIFCNETLDLLDYVLKKVDEKITIPEVIIPGDLPNLTHSDVNVTLDELDINYTSFTTPIPHIEDENSLDHQFIIYLRGKIDEALVKYTKRIVEFIEDEGWNGNDSMEDLKWSVPGAILYAVTVITTIGYGHATPKTNAGKFLTILYALIGIPLMFLYLSNIGDYLADVFRVLYSKTCRRSCEHFCSASIFNCFSRKAMKETKTDQQNDVDTPGAPQSSHNKRKKRVLLTAITRRIDPIDDGICIKETESNKNNHSEDQLESGNNHLSDKNKMQSTLTFLMQSIRQNVTRNFVGSRIEKLYKSAKATNIAKRTKSGLKELYIPVFNWLHKTIQNIIYPPEIENKLRNIIASKEMHESGLVNSPNLFYQNPAQESEYDLLRNECSPAKSLACTTATALIEENDNENTTDRNSNDPKFLSRSLNQKYFMEQAPCFGPSTSQNLNPTLSNALSLQPFMFGNRTLGQTDSQQVLRNSTRYFTYDGRHRKFYIMARYLRSAQRQRRHKRRVERKLREQERMELQRLENELAYGKPKVHKKIRTVKMNQSEHSIDEKKSEQFSLSSLPNSENEDIKLLCWRDIDLDLEVRSVDDEQELKQLAQQVSASPEENVTPKIDPIKNRYHLSSKPDFSQSTFTFLDEEKVMDYQKDESKAEPNTYSSRGIIKYDLKQPKTKPQVYPSHNVTNETINNPDYGYPKRRSSLINLSQGTFLTEDPTSIERQRSHRPMPATKQIPHKAIYPRSTSSVFFKDSIIMTPSSSNAFPVVPKCVNDIYKGPSSTMQQIPAIPNIFPNMNHSHSLQPEVIQSLLNSTVIANPLVLEEPTSEAINKPATLGRSRLSLASSQGDLNSEVVVRLSYYSQQGSAHTEEELSFFSYRDGFSAEEDVSKVTVPISLSLLIMTTYILIGAIVFSIWQDPDYLKWSYFCFITLSTIGFGDIVPGTKIDSTNPKEKLIIISLYVAIGLSVFAMCFKLMQEEVVDKMKWFASKVGILRNKEAEKSDKSEKNL